MISGLLGPVVGSARDRAAPWHGRRVRPCDRTSTAGTKAVEERRWRRRFDHLPSNRTTVAAGGRVRVGQAPSAVHVVAADDERCLYRPHALQPEHLLQLGHRPLVVGHRGRIAAARRAPARELLQLFVILVASSFRPGSVFFHMICFLNFGRTTLVAVVAENGAREWSVAGLEPAASAMVSRVRGYPRLGRRYLTEKFLNRAWGRDEERTQKE